MKKCDKLYIGFRKFVQQNKLTDYDNEFFEKKSRTYKFMIPYIHKYVNVDKLKNKLEHKDDIEIFKFFNVYANRHPNGVDEVKSMEATHNINFLFKNQDSFHIE